MLNGIAPFFIVDDLPATLRFYASLGFHVMHQGEFWAMIARDNVMLMLKAIAPDIHPQPNPSRHEWARWDAYIHTADPDSLYAEYAANNVPIRRPVASTGDGLRAFEIADNNGYVLCFGRPE